MLDLAYAGIDNVHKSDLMMDDDKQTLSRAVQASY